MKRSGGVVASAVVAILGSALMLLFAFFAALTAVAAPFSPGAFPENPTGMPAAPFSITAILLGEAVVFFALGVFGILASIALLRLKNWARISFLVFGGLLGVLGVFGMLASVVILVLTPQLVQATPDVPSGFFRAIFGVALVLYLMLAALGVGWLVYFTRPYIKTQFLTDVRISVPSRGPLSVKIIAWILAISGGISLLYLPFAVPAALFGMVFRGWGARILLLSFGLTALFAGIGMLKWRPRAHSLAVFLYVFGILNTLSLLVFPDSIASFQQIFLEMVPQAPGPVGLSTTGLTRIMMVSGLFGGMIGSAIPLWFLVTRRRAFLDACKTPSPRA